MRYVRTLSEFAQRKAREFESSHTRPSYQYQIRAHSISGEEGNVSHDYGDLLWEEPRGQTHLDSADLTMWRASLVRAAAKRLANKRQGSVAICSRLLTDERRTFTPLTFVQPDQKRLPALKLVTL